MNEENERKGWKGKITMCNLFSPVEVRADKKRVKYGKMAMKLLD